MSTVCSLSPLPPTGQQGLPTECAALFGRWRELGLTGKSAGRWCVWRGCADKNTKARWERGGGQVEGLSFLLIG